MYTSDTQLRGHKQEIFNPGTSMEFEIINSNSVLLKWNPLKLAVEKDDFFDSNKLDNINNASVEYKIYQTSSKQDFSYMDSVCFLNKLSKKELNEIEIKNEGNKYVAKIPKLKTGQSYYLNVLGKDLITNDIYAYKSIQVVTRNNEFPFILIGKNIF